MRAEPIDTIKLFREAEYTEGVLVLIKNIIDILSSAGAEC